MDRLGAHRRCWLTPPLALQQRRGKVWDGTCVRTSDSTAAVVQRGCSTSEAPRSEIVGHTRQVARCMLLLMTVLGAGVRGAVPAGVRVR
ncbi:hypothetical protein EON66_04520 [archaeon]|nr:MAG: hypothetical protein EON66_04520 [archaeon]